ncbi:MAG: metallophosphoesterase family protein [Spirochaetota bacterium]
MYYLIGDIHGCIDHLDNLYSKIKNLISDNDTLIFLGDYIDRGPDSYEVIEYLISLSKENNTIFLKGNHEDMLLKYKSSSLDYQNYMENGGMATIKSYKKNLGSFTIPLNHQVFFNNLTQYFESEDFIAVHAGLNPKIYNIEAQSSYDMLWIRDKFFRDPRKWEKTIIFGHTPCSILSGQNKEIYFNKDTNIIGIDTGACYGGVLTCLRWPDKSIYQE